MKWLKHNGVWLPLDQTTLTEADWYRLKERGRIPVCESEDHPLIALCNEDSGEDR